MLAGLLQQHRRIDQVGTELAGERKLGKFAGDAQPHEQLQVLRRAAIGRAARLDDLRQLFLAIEAEGAASMLVIGFGDRTLGLHRVHKAQFGLRQDRTNQAHLDDRCDVVMRHAVIPQDADEIGRRVGLDRVERTPAKTVDEETRRARSRVRAVEDNRFVGREGFDYGSSVRMCGQFKGPPKRLGFRTGRSRGCLAV